MSEIEQKRYYTVSEVAQILNVTTNSVYNWIRAGELKAVKIGKTLVRISNKSLRKFTSQSYE